MGGSDRTVFRRVLVARFTVLSMLVTHSFLGVCCRAGLVVIAGVSFRHDSDSEERGADDQQSAEQPAPALGANVHRVDRTVGISTGT